MNWDTYKTTLGIPLTPQTLCFLLSQSDILLGLKKRGFGKGNYVGIGGKVEKGETIEHAAIREVGEEIRVKPVTIIHIATLEFYFPQAPDISWNQIVYVFNCTKWEGEPEETDEMQPKWFPNGQLLYENMWDDAKHWLSLTSLGNKVYGRFSFDNQFKVKELLITHELPPLP